MRARTLMRRLIGGTTPVLVVALAAACADDPQRAPAPGAGASPLVPLASRAPSIVQDLRYAGSDNFVGRPIDGYRAARCLLTPAAADALARVQRDLAASGEGLVVFDCYRPQRAVDDFVRWAADPDEATRAAHYPNVEKSQLIPEGYIAARSSHSRGSTVDVGLLRWAGSKRGWQPLDMGTDFDFFDPRSHTESGAVTGAQRANRLQLREAMRRRGFRNLPEEWWHFTLDPEPYPDHYFDVPVQ